MKTGAINGYLPLQFGGRVITVAGGPYRNKPNGVAGVCMAQEFAAFEYDRLVSVPTKDFCVPTLGDFVAGVERGLHLALSGFPLYVGCMGGIGRTGLYLGGLAKVAAAYNMSWMDRGLQKPVDTDEVIRYVRAEYMPHAIETDEQKRFLANYNPHPTARWLRAKKIV